LAHTQYYGWGLKNRANLLPSAAQIASADAAVEAARAYLGNTMEILHVIPDYHADYPKPCMNGWGSTHLTIVPNGKVLPCPAASAIRTLSFANVREHSLSWIWHESPAFNAYRGEDWMQEPCRTCARRSVDHGGCRCQAFILTGDARRADPVCHLSPDHGIITDWRARSNQPAQPEESETLVHRVMTARA
jgi:pyrroloquinoline quinone biosynthesis protein E